MTSTITIDQKTYIIDLSKGRSIGMVIDPERAGPSCFQSGRPTFSPIVYGDQQITVRDGAPVNFYEMHLIPHGHGTHTECVGHITDEMPSMSDVELPFFIKADLITVKPEPIGDDLVITESSVRATLVPWGEAIILRTLPNTADKLLTNYNQSNPPYLQAEAVQYLVDQGYQHLLIDMPSVDKEQDGGALAAHKTWWQEELAQGANRRTITEMIYVDPELEDGHYLLHFDLLPMTLDAVPSNPVLFGIQEDGLDA